MATLSNSDFTNIDTSNLDFTLSQRIKGVIECDLNPESELMIIMFLPPEIESQALLSFITISKPEQVWQIKVIEVFEILDDLNSLNRLGYLDFDGLDWDELTIGHSREELLEKWQTDFANQLDRYSGLVPNTNFTLEHFDLIEQANSFYAELIEEQLPELVNER